MVNGALVAAVTLTIIAHCFCLGDTKKKMGRERENDYYKFKRKLYVNEIAETKHKNFSMDNCCAINIHFSFRLGLRLGDIFGRRSMIITESTRNKYKSVQTCFFPCIGFVLDGRQSKAIFIHSADRLSSRVAAAATCPLDYEICISFISITCQVVIVFT